jgi:cell division protein FtsQ
MSPVTSPPTSLSTGKAPFVARSNRARRWRLVRTRSDTLSAGLRKVAGHVWRPSSRLGWVVGIGTVVTLGVSAWVVFGTPVLGVRTVEVTGSQIASPDQVRAVAAVVEGTPLARVDVDQVGQRVRAMPPVASVSVHRSWPSTVRIEITERVPVAAVAVAGGFAIVDADGIVFDTRAQRPDSAVLLKVALLRPEDPTTRAALRVVAALTPPLRTRLTQLVADSPTHIRLELAGGRTIVWGDADNNEMKARVAAALLDRPAKTIDVSSPEVATTS